MNKYIEDCVKEKKIHLDVILTKHCNLNCRGCSRFCGLSKPGYYDYNTLVKDLFTLSKIKEVATITFSGGEPLLYPKDLLIDILKLSRKLFPYVGLTIFTNGKNLLREDFEDVLNCIAENRICIVYSKYVKTTIDYDKIEKICKSLDINIKNINTVTVNKDLNPEEITEFTLMKHTIKPYSNDNKLDLCVCNIPTLWDSKIYCCGDCIFLDTLNKKFGTKYNVNDFINIEKLNIQTYIDLVQSKHEICKYCMNIKPQKIEWSQEKSTKEDYIG